MNALTLLPIALTDGVFSITATLMLLDFRYSLTNSYHSTTPLYQFRTHTLFLYFIHFNSSQGLPSVSSVQQDYKGSLIAALDDERYIFFSYIVSFIIIGKFSSLLGKNKHIKRFYASFTWWKVWFIMNLLFVKYKCVGKYIHVQYSKLS